eukprot:RCo000120
MLPGILSSHGSFSKKGSFRSRPGKPKLRFAEELSSSVEIVLGEPPAALPSPTVTPLSTFTQPRLRGNGERGSPTSPLGGQQEDADRSITQHLLEESNRQPGSPGLSGAVVQSMLRRLHFGMASSESTDLLMRYLQTEDAPAGPLYSETPATPGEGAGGLDVSCGAITKMWAHPRTGHLVTAHQGGVVRTWTSALQPLPRHTVLRDGQYITDGVFLSPTSMLLCTEKPVLTVISLTEGRTLRRFVGGTDGPYKAPTPNYFKSSRCKASVTELCLKAHRKQAAKSAQPQPSDSDSCTSPESTPGSLSSSSSASVLSLVETVTLLQLTDPVTSVS